MVKFFKDLAFGFGMSTAFYIFPKVEQMTPEEYSNYRKVISNKSKKFFINVNKNFLEEDNKNKNDDKNDDK